MPCPLRSHHVSQPSTPYVSCHRTLPLSTYFTDGKSVSLSSCDAPPGWQGIPGVWPWALEPAHLGSDLPSALCWLLTFSKCHALLSIGILICKMGTLIVPASQGHCKDA